MSNNLSRLDQLRSEIQSEPTFFVKNQGSALKKYESKGPDPSGFLSKEEAAVFWKNINPSPFPKKLRQTPQSLAITLDRLGPLKKDVSELVLLHLFSDCHLTTHPSMFGAKPHPVFRIRTKQPLGSAPRSKDNAPESASATTTPTKNKVSASSEQPHGTKAQIAFLVRNKVLPKSDNPSFKEMFPSTDLPHLTFVNGLPKCNKSTFNMLLVSKLRASKTSLAIKASDRLSIDLVRHISRLIDKSMISAFNDKKKGKKTDIPPTDSANNRKPAQEPSQLSTSPSKSKKEKKKKTKKTPGLGSALDLASRFTSAGTQESPLPAPTNEEESRFDDLPSRPSTPLPPVRNSFFEPEQSMSHLRPENARLMYDAHRRLIRFRLEREPLTTPARHTLQRLGFGFFASIIDGPEMPTVRDISDWYDMFIKLVHHDGAYRGVALTFHDAPSHDSIEDDLLPFYRDRSLASLQSACTTLEILVMEIRSLE